MSLPRPMSKLRLSLLTFGLLLIWVIVITNVASANTSAIAPSSSTNLELKNTRNCKALCEHCGCLGFYCGEECLCECNKKNDENSDSECIQTMQNNARKLNIPFELLIQGPDSNRYVHNALQFAEKDHLSPMAVGARNKRSTVVIYKPAMLNSINGQCDRKDVPKVKSLIARHKRSTPELDWFNDFANTLVRPAPLRQKQTKEAAVRNVEAAAPMQKKRASTDRFDQSSWFTDNNHALFRPAPLFKRRFTTHNDDDKSEESSYDSPLSAVERIPDMIKETIRNLQQPAFKGDDFADVYREKPKLVDPYSSEMQNKFDFYPKSYGKFAETLADMPSAIVRNDVQVPTIAPNTPAPPQEFKVMNPWLRPVRFLQRVRQAIN